MPETSLVGMNPDLPRRSGFIPTPILPRQHDTDLDQRDEMYFSRRIWRTGRPNSCSAAYAASTMFGLPHR